jgi:hypothetical protein
MRYFETLYRTDQLKDFPEGERQLASGFEDPMHFSNGYFSADRVVNVVDCKAR